MMWAYSSGNFLAFNFSYLELIPAYKCLLNDTVSANGELGPTNETLDQELNYTTCTPSDFCGTDIPYEVDWSQPDSLHNWAITLNLACTF